MYDRSTFVRSKTILQRLSIGMSDKDRSASKQTDRSDQLIAPTISSDIADLKAAMSEMMYSFKTEIFAHVSDSISQVYQDFNLFEEKIMCNRLLNFLERHRIIYSKQFRFRAHHATDHAILSITDKIQRAIDDQEYSCGIFLHFSKAFDTINHDVLIAKMEHYGIT